MSVIFISYRREDAKHAAGRLVDRLVAAVGRDQLFMDIDNIEPGLDFVKVLNDQVAKCDVLVALIGPKWLDARDKHGVRRLDNPNDFVRIEIEAALARDIRVIPVLLDGAEMPAQEDLPESLRLLTRRQARSVSHERFASEADDLAQTMKRALGLEDGARGPPKTLEGDAPSASLKRAFGVHGAQRNAATAAPEPTPHRPVDATSRGPAASAAPHASNRRPTIVAVVFALSAAPLTILIAGQGSLNSYKIQVFLFCTVLAVTTAIVLARRRGSALTGTEVTLYWFGSALIAVMVTLALSKGSIWEGVAEAILAAVLSGLALVFWWARRRAGGG